MKNPIDDREFKRSMVTYKQRQKHAIEKGLAKSLLHLLGVAAQDAPVDEGTLRGSGSAILNGQSIGTSQAEGKGGAPATTDNIGEKEPWGVVGFNTPYASAQDQRPDLVHPKGGEAGYLTGNAERHKKIYVKWIADEIKRAT